MTTLLPSQKNTTRVTPATPSHVRSPPLLESVVPVVAVDATRSMLVPFQNQTSGFSGPSRIQPMVPLDTAGVESPTATPSVVSAWMLIGRPAVSKSPSQ